MKLINIYRKYCLGDYEKIQLLSKNRRERMLKYIIYSPALLIKSFLAFVYDNTLGKYIVRKNWKNGLNDYEYKYKLAMTCIVKNEALYIAEWIEYYLILGVEHFFIYDNGSDDNIRNVLESYIKDGIVDYIFFPGQARQLLAYNDSIKNNIKSVKYMICADLDEFIVYRDSKNTFFQFIDSFFSEHQYTSGIAINWSIFGSSFHIKKQRGLILENYIHRAELSDQVNRSIKTIFCPMLIKGYCFNPHIPESRLGCVIRTISGNKISDPWNDNLRDRQEYLTVNHYFCKSKEEGELKRQRGIATSAEYEQYKVDEYNKNDKNDVLDDFTLRYVDVIKTNLKIRKLL